MTTTQTEYDQLAATLDAEGPAAVLERLANQLRESKRYHELFEALKMQVRQRIGLPLLYGDSGDELDESTRNQLEEGLLEACREVGNSLLANGAIREGWMYLRPVGDQESVAKLVAEIEADEDNIDELVEVCLHEGVDPARGFGLVLEHYGTCNSITTYESALHQRSRSEQQACAGMLVEHLHGELLATVKADIAQQQGTEPPETTLRELVHDRDWLFGEHSYHVDTTHLASTVRFARVLEDETQLRMALDLTEYGRHLSEQFQYQGDEPFAEIYPSHALYFQALLGEDVDAALEYFRDKAESLDAYENGLGPIECYVGLLSRVGRNQDAISEALRLSPDDARPTGQAPTLLELSEAAGTYDDFLKYCREKDDILGFTTGLLKSQESNTEK